MSHTNNQAKFTATPTQTYMKKVFPFNRTKECIQLEVFIFLFGKSVFEIM